MKGKHLSQEDKKKKRILAIKYLETLVGPIAANYNKKNQYLFLIRYLTNIIGVFSMLKMVVKLKNLVIFLMLMMLN